MFHINFTYVLHARPLRICICTPSSAPIDRSPGGFGDSAKSKCRKHAIFGPLLEVKMLKSARRCSAKRISKSKCTKHLSVGRFLEVAMSKKCTSLWREVHLEVKMLKTLGVRTIFRSSDLEKVHAVVMRKTFGNKWRFKCRFASLH